MSSGLHPFRSSLSSSFSGLYRCLLVCYCWFWGFGVARCWLVLDATTACYCWPCHTLLSWWLAGDSSSNFIWLGLSDGWLVRLSSVVFVQFLFVFDLVSLRFVVNLFINDF